MIPISSHIPITSAFTETASHYELKECKSNMAKVKGAVEQVIASLGVGRTVKAISDALQAELECAWREDIMLVYVPFEQAIVGRRENVLMANVSNITTIIDISDYKCESHKANDLWDVYSSVIVPMRHLSYRRDRVYVGYRVCLFHDRMPVLYIVHWSNGNWAHRVYKMDMEDKTDSLTHICEINYWQGPQDMLQVSQPDPILQPFDGQAFVQYSESPLVQLVYQSAFSVYHQLGPGHSVSVYRSALSLELHSGLDGYADVSVVTEVPAEQSYTTSAGVQLSIGETLFADIVLNRQHGSFWKPEMVIEIKSCADVKLNHIQQMKLYQNLLDSTTGYVINFPNLLSSQPRCPQMFDYLD